MAGSPAIEEQITDPELLDFFEHRVRRTAEEFNLDPASFPRPALLAWREGAPERVHLPGDPPGCLIYLGQGSDWWQARYQLAHEVTHATLAPSHLPLEWVEEMFAIHTAIRAMREIDADRYADDAEARLWRESEQGDFTLAQMRDVELADGYPEGLYPRAYATGRELIDGIGWERLKALGVLFDDAGKHDVPAWIETLDGRERRSVEDVLGG